MTIKDIRIQQVLFRLYFSIFAVKAPLSCLLSLRMQFSS